MKMLLFSLTLILSSSAFAQEVASHISLHQFSNTQIDMNGVKRFNFIDKNLNTVTVTCSGKAQDSKMSAVVYDAKGAVLQAGVVSGSQAACENTFNQIARAVALGKSAVIEMGPEYANARNVKQSDIVGIGIK